MSEKTPRVWEVQGYGAERGRRALLSDPSEPGADILVDSPAWFAWLEASTTTRFSYPLFDPVRGYIMGFMTVRKEQRKRARATGRCIGGVRGVCRECTSDDRLRSPMLGSTRLPPACASPQSTDHR